MVEQMNGASLRAWRTGLGMTQDHAAAALEVSKRSLIRYEQEQQQAIPEKVAARIEALKSGGAEPPASMHVINDPAALIAKARAAGRLTEAQTAAPVNLIGVTENGKLQVGADGMLYGLFEPILPAVARIIDSTGHGVRAMWSEEFSSASGHGFSSMILWGCLPGEPDKACAPILMGRHYRPARFSADKVSSPDAPARPKAGGRRKAA